MIQFAHRKFKEWTVHSDDPTKMTIIKFDKVGDAKPYFIGKEWQYCHVVETRLGIGGVTFKDLTLYLLFIVCDLYYYV